MPKLKNALSKKKPPVVETKPETVVPKIDKQDELSPPVLSAAAGEQVETSVAVTAPLQYPDKDSVVHLSPSTPAEVTHDPHPQLPSAESTGEPVIRQNTAFPSDQALQAEQLAAPQPEAKSTSRPNKRRFFKKSLIIIPLLLIALAGATVLFTGLQPNEQQIEKSLISEMSARVVTPKDEIPAVSTVVNKDEINQAFLSNAEKGDKVFLYFKAGKAIVYRPSTKQIVNIGPLTEPSPKVFVRNGTVRAVPASVKTKIEQSGQYIVSSQDASPKRTYKKTLVIDVAGNRPDVAGSVARLLGATVAQLPEGESNPDADILVIVGSDAR